MKRRETKGPLLRRRIEEPVDGDAIHEAYDAGEDLNFELFHKEWRGGDIHLGKLGAIVFLGQLLQEQRGGCEGYIKWNGGKGRVTYGEVPVYDLTPLEVLVGELDDDKGGLGGHLEKLLLLFQLRVHPVRVGLHILQSLGPSRSSSK